MAEGDNKNKTLQPFLTKSKVTMTIVNTNFRKSGVNYDKYNR